MKKRIVSLTLAALMLVSCSGNDSSTAGGGADLSGEPVKSAYSGAESLMGMDYGKFTMPSAFEVPVLTDVYSLNYNFPRNILDKQKAVEIIGKVMGDELDKTRLRDDGFGGVYFDPDDDPDWLAGYADGFLYAFKPVYDEYKESVTYSVSSEGDTAVTVGNAETSVGQIAGSVDALLPDLLSGAMEGFDIRAERVSLLDNGYINVLCSMNIDSVPIQYIASSYLKLIGGEYREEYISFSLHCYLDKNLKLCGLDFYDPPTVLSKEKLDSIISLKKAVSIVRDNLGSEYDSYDISDVRLMYCSMVRSPDVSGFSEEESVLEAERVSEVRTLTPTWTFFIKRTSENENDACIKVNAVTGELFMDIYDEKLVNY